MRLGTTAAFTEAAAPNKSVRHAAVSTKRVPLYPALRIYNTILYYKFYGGDNLQNAEPAFSIFLSLQNEAYGIYRKKSELTR